MTGKHPFLSGALLALLLILVSAGARQTNEVGGKKMKSFAIGGADSLAVVKTDLSGWEQVTSVGVYNPAGEDDLDLLQFNGTLTGRMPISANFDKKFGMRLRRLRHLADGDTLAIYVNGAAGAAHLIFWGS